ncbi:IS66 family insertion sequence element accessory protein TnpB (plasmid) [Pandoraea sp. XJJ-1]|nr:IS66 family insertion sequence element accessory protein TnpB [Pandoraea sp. XJJ-1]WAL85469.1 IS66 family insertion sequence element accessory protein TnpB [Pandoraea sp. XJJ-1]
MIRIDVIWLALGAADLRGGIDTLLAQVVRGFALGAQAHHAYVFANRRADRLKVLVYDGAGMWLCTRRLQAGSFAWPRQDTGSLQLTREQFDWLVAGLPWQRLEQSGHGIRVDDFGDPSRVDRLGPVRQACSGNGSPMSARMRRAYLCWHFGY